MVTSHLYQHQHHCCLVPFFEIPNHEVILRKPWGLFLVYSGKTKCGYSHRISLDSEILLVIRNNIFFQWGSPQIKTIRRSPRSYGVVHSSFSLLRLPTRLGYTILYHIPHFFNNPKNHVDGDVSHYINYIQLLSSRYPHFLWLVKQPGNTSMINRN